MDIGSIGTANTSAWFSQTAPAQSVQPQQEGEASGEALDSYQPQTTAQPVGDLYDWQGTVVDAFA